jgi:hypothetical protein
MMGMALDFVLSPLWPKDTLDRADLERVANCRDSIYVLADSTIEKHGEDKHSFLVSDLIASAEIAGFGHSCFYSNRHFQDLADTDLSNRQGRCSFTAYLESFLEQHHRVSQSGMRAIHEFLFPVLAKLDARFQAGDGAPLLGCIVFRR